MNEKVRAFLDAKRNAEKARYEQEKRETLIRLGLSEKEYSPTGGWNAQYLLWDSTNNQYYKETPLEITDEEYQEIKKYDTNAGASDLAAPASENAVAVVLRVLACIIFVVGFFAGLMSANMEVTTGHYYTRTETQFSFTVALTYWSVAFVTGMLFFGFSEVVKLLNDIRNKN